MAAEPKKTEAQKYKISQNHGNSYPLPEEPKPQPPSEPSSEDRGDSEIHMPV